MITFTDEARKHVVSFLELENEELAVRIRLLDSSPLAPRYDLSLIERSGREDDDRILDLMDFQVVVDSQSAELLQGAKVDWIENVQGGGFKIENPNIKPIGEEPVEGPLADRVRQAIDMQINPAIAVHGGSVSLVDVRGRAVYLEMHGGCQGCGMAAATLAQGIRQILMEAVPDVERIVDVTNHAAGTDPYFSPAK
jgi:Fe/S biogenesis protein NfuA